MRAKGNTLPQYGRSAGWTEIRGLGKSGMKSLFLSQRMAGLPSGLSEKDLNVQVSKKKKMLISYKGFLDCDWT